jgi:GNAT superfamily N-acetyltransferase
VTDFNSAGLEDHHKLDEFDCGKAGLNDWLITQAHRANNSGTAKTYVWTPNGSDRVVAYYAITPHVIVRQELPSRLQGGVETSPAYLLARLALDRSLHGKGLGGDLLRDALEIIVDAASRASGRLIVVDAIDEMAASFYAKYDFRPVRNNPMRLVLKIATARESLYP